MNLSGGFSRRLFLQMVLSLHVYVLKAPAYPAARKDASNISDPLPSKLASFFLHQESAKTVGVAYLRIAPMEADVSLLTNLICSCSEEQRMKFLHAEARIFRELLRERLCHDFERDRVVNVHGWILAVTEARLCALTALM